MNSHSKYASIKLFALPSSSPANAHYSFASLVESWSIIREHNRQ